MGRGSAPSNGACARKRWGLSTRSTETIAVEATDSTCCDVIWPPAIKSAAMADAAALFISPPASNNGASAALMWDSRFFSEPAGRPAAATSHYGMSQGSGHHYPRLHPVRSSPQGTAADTSTRGTTANTGTNTSTCTDGRKTDGGKNKHRGSSGGLPGALSLVARPARRKPGHVDKSMAWHRTDQRTCDDFTRATQRRHKTQQHESRTIQRSALQRRGAPSAPAQLRMAACQ